MNWNRRSVLGLLAASPLAAKTFSHTGKEEQPFRGNKEAELMRQDGKGCLTHMWFGGAWDKYLLTRIRVYVDGEAKPSIEFDLGMGHGIGFEDSAGPWGTALMGKTGHPSGVYNYFRIPFGGGIRVTAQLAPGVRDDVFFWWILRGSEQAWPEIGGAQLPASARLKLQKREDLAVPTLEEFDLYKTDRSGALFLVAMQARSRNFHYLEAIVRAYHAGQSEPSMLSSGLEDYFLGTYYFNRGRYHTENAGLTHFNKKQSAFAAYRFHHQDPVYFENGLRLTCRCGEQRGKTIFGGNPGKPQLTTYTTYTWAYEW